MKKERLYKLGYSPKAKKHRPRWKTAAACLTAAILAGNVCGGTLSINVQATGLDESQTVEETIEDEPMQVYDSEEGSEDKNLQNSDSNMEEEESLQEDLGNENFPSEEASDSPEEEEISSEPEELTGDVTSGTEVLGETDLAGQQEEISDESADVETSEQWEKTLPQPIPEKWDEAVVAVAESQIGYQESRRNFQQTDNGEKQGYTRYGAWSGDAYGKWDSSFVSFCLYYSGVENMPQDQDCQKWVEALQEMKDSLYRVKGGELPQTGDLIFFHNSEEDGDTADHIGIITAVAEATADAPAKVTVVEGDSQDQVEANEYLWTDPRILGSASLPPQESAAENEHLELDNQFTYADENIHVEITIQGDAVKEQKETSLEGTSAGEVSMNVTPLTEDQPEYQEVTSYITENGGDENVINVSVIGLEFIYEGQPLDVSSCEIAAEVTPADKLQEAADAIEVEGEIAEEAEVGVEIAALQSTGEGRTEVTDSVILEKDEETLPTMTLALNAQKPMLQLVARSALNPHFTVQYYANLDVVKQDDSGLLRVIDTTGGKLPQNGVGVTTKGLVLQDEGNNKYSIATEKKLTKLYEQNEYDYYNAPSLDYFNILDKNDNYEIAEVWVLKGGDPNSTNRSDWTIYPNDGTLHFTNSSVSVGGNTIQISDGTVIRLVAESTTAMHQNDAVFYDYDITDGKGNVTSMNIQAPQGINSAENYKGTGVKFAFGNKNTGTGLGEIKWNGQTLNAFNYNNTFDDKKNLLGATFGLVKGLDSSGNLQYADGIMYLPLFGEGGATGKTTYNGWKLGFDRSGDTYTLSMVSDANNQTLLTGLDQFNHPNNTNQTYDHIWTNNFWPMDAYPGADGLTGTFDHYDPDGDAMASEQYHTGSSGGTTAYYPASDDGVPHNNLFGMQYAVEFELTDDYVGPLEYYFFGDDDMWVFLTDPQGNSTLVCDLGGVHSSLGEYVNLWDYIAKGSEGKYKLSFFYTERGLSGSSCYMQFTLPSVSSIPITHDTGQLKIEKQVVGSADENLEFSFDLTLTDANGNKLIDDYSIMRYAADGSTSAELIQGGKGSFKLKANEYVIIDHLPYGTKYAITETNVSGGCTVSNTVNSGQVDYDVTADGQIQNGQNGSVVFTNTFRPKLPNTGGTGTTLFVFGGMFLMGLAYAGITYRKRKGMR